MILTSKYLETIFVNFPFRGAHLFVLVHGFQGNSFDMRLIKNTIAYLYPNILFLCSAANEDDTECKIEIMGLRLAGEVKNFISDSCPGKKLWRFNLINSRLIIF